MKNLIQNLTKEKTLINKVFLALLCSQLVIILATFFKVAMLPSFGKLNLYALDSVAVLFLISSVIEIVFTLKKNEKVFIPLRVVNLLWLFSMIGNLTKQIENLQMTESAMGVTLMGAGVVENLYSWLTFGIVDFAIPKSGYSSLLGTVNVIRIVADISLVLLLVYLYFRFIKKDAFDTTPCLEVRFISELQTAYHLDQIVTIASIALIVSPFLRFMSNGPIVVTAFGRKPFFALATVVLGVVVIHGVLSKDAKVLGKSILATLITFILWNPIYVMRQGRFGLGYILYLAGVITLGVIYIKRQEVRTVGTEAQPTKTEETKNEEPVVEEQPAKEEQDVHQEGSKLEDENLNKE